MCDRVVGAQDDSIGFVKIVNRIIVALSRAKHGTTSACTKKTKNKKQTKTYKNAPRGWTHRNDVLLGIAHK